MVKVQFNFNTSLDEEEKASITDQVHGAIKHERLFEGQQEPIVVDVSSADPLNQKFVASMRCGAKTALLKGPI